MKTNALRIALSTILLSLLVPATALAADQIVKLPDGWRADSDLFAASTQNAAVPLRSTDAAAGARVLQVREAQQVVTDIPGAVAALAYSADGKNLLVRYLAVEHGEKDNPSVQAVKVSRARPAGESSRTPADDRTEEGATVRVTKVALIGPTGEIAWTKTDGRTFEFSTTGEAIAASREENGTGLRSDVEIFDLAGKHLRTLPVSKFAADHALVLMDGKRALLAIERALACEDFAAGGGTVWRYDLGRGEPDIVSLGSLAPDKIVLQLGQGRFKLFQPTGTLAYDYDPVTVALTYPDLTEAEYAKASPELGPNPCTLTIFGGTPQAKQLQLASSKLLKKFVSLDAPGYTRTGPVVAGKMLFVGADSILIRSLQDEFKPVEASPTPIEPAPIPVETTLKPLDIGRN